MKNYFFRCTAIFILILSLGVGHSWADEITVYVTGEIFIGTGENAWDNATSTIKVDVRKGHPECFDCDGFNGLYNQDMTNTGYTYNGYPIYSYTLNQAGAQFRFKHYKSGAFKENYTTDWHSTTNQIYQGYYSEAHHWITYGRDVTFYATPKKMDGSKWEEGTHSLFANFKYGDGESEWKRQQMTKTAYTYNGNAIYTCTMLLPYNVIKKVQFLYNDGSDHDLYVYTPSPQLTANDLDGKILLGWNGSSHNWVSYGRDVTVYTIPDYLFKGYETPYNENNHYPAVCIQMGTGNTWNTVNMTKTAYTYNAYPIYKATILIDQNKFWEYQIKYLNKTDNSPVGLYQFNQSEPKTEYAPSYIDDKLYHGYNGQTHDFFSYRYDVALDMQSGGGGSTSIIAIDGAAMPSDIMPGRDGYIFGGYWTETNGGGTQYYNADGSSTRNWDSRTITTLYAKWTARNYTITLEGMEAETQGDASVTVTFDASTNMTSAINTPTKSHYTFDGYWTDKDNYGATLGDQLIDANGMWIKDIDPYTGHDGSGNPTWIYPNHKSLFAKWTEDLHEVTVAVSPAGAGSVTLNGSPISKVENIGYVTHSAEMIAVPENDAWVFKEWQVTDPKQLDLEHYSMFKPTMKITATGEGQTLTAVFTYCWALKAETEGWGQSEFPIENISTNGDGDVIGYADISLPANTNLQFQMLDKSTDEVYKNNGHEVFYMTYDNHTTDWGFSPSYTQNCGITTAGKGTYRFTWNITDKTMNFTYPTSYQVNYGASVGGSVTSVVDGEGKAVPNGGYVVAGGSVTYTAEANTYYTFVGWCNNEMYGDPFNTDLSWTNSNVTETQNSFAKFKSTNFVIYRTGDMAEDDRAAYDDVESYAGGTIEKAIEFRMKVHRLDKWYTLCLPFTVSAVKVWDEEERKYYDIIPYWRTEGTYYTGHYIIRTPVSTTNFAIENFDSRDRWTDPESGEGYLPSANTPYIIQWHDPYFLGKYISFFGATNQTIPTSMYIGTNSGSDETVNIYGNDAMTSGTVLNAYMLDPDYGPSGAWLRENIGIDRTVLPFECFIRANETTTAKYRVLRRDAVTDSIPTAIDLTPSLNEREGAAYKMLMNNRIYIIRHGRIYTMQGTLVKEIE